MSDKEDAKKYDWETETKERIEKLLTQAGQARQQANKLVEFATKSEGAAECLNDMLNQAQDTPQETNS